MPPTYRNDREYVRRREALFKNTRANNTPCHLCGKPFDFDLPYTHPMSLTADHLNPVANGGSMTGPLAPAHRACNSRKGKRTNMQKPAETKTSRQW